jgi:nucleoside-diphosphate-sugar epimerase
MCGVALIEECLQNGIRVFALVQENSQKLGRLPKSDLLRCVPCDLADLSSLAERGDLQGDVFYHLAWIASGADRDNSLRAQADNIRYTLDAVALAASLGCKKFVGAGSQAEYGARPPEAISPETPTNPTQPYGIAKLAAGRLAMLESERLGMICNWVRIFSVYGIHDHANSMVSTALSAFLAGQPMSFSAATNLWDYLFSRDAGRALYAIGQAANTSKTYCLGSGEAKPLRAYIESMQAATGIAVGSGIGDNGAASQINLLADISSLTCDTGFTPLYSFERGIQETIAHIKKKP